MTKGIFFLLWLGFSPLVLAGVLSPEIQNATVETLQRRLETYGDSSPVSEKDRAELLLALGAIEDERGHPHAAAKALNQIEGFCNRWRVGRFEVFQGKERGRAVAVCALAGAELIANSFPLFQWGRLRKLGQDLFDFQLADMDEAERLYLTARLRSALGPLEGQDFRTALVSWRVLERAHPQTPGIDYGLGLTLFRQGNTQASEEAFEKAVLHRDPRALARAERLALSNEEEVGFGIAPMPFFSPARGVGLGVRVWNDRIADQKHSLFAMAAISTRGNIGGSLRLREFEWTGPFVLEISGRGGNRVQDFFGLGISSGPVAQSFMASLFEGEVGVSYRWRGITFVAGGTGQSFSSATLPAGLFTEAYRGIFGEVIWDSRDKVFLPRRGSRLSIRQEWLTTSAKAFSRIRVAGELHLPLHLWHGVSLSFSGVGTQTDALYNLLPDLGMLGMPAVREFRYRGAFAAGAWFQYRYRVSNWLRAGAFANVGTVGLNTAEFFPSARGGFGVSAEFSFERAPRVNPRWEFGYFNQQWIFQGGLRAEF